MKSRNPRVAIVFPADAEKGAGSLVEQSRLAGVAEALGAAGMDVVSAPYADAIARACEARLADVEGVLVWFNPIEAGRNRTQLNALLRTVAARGAVVSAHPDVIDRMGTKDVLYRTRAMGWGCDTRRYRSGADMGAALPLVLVRGPRVLKQMRGQSGDGVWKVSLPDAASLSSQVSADAPVRVQHAKRGSVEEIMPLREWLARCESYFAEGGGMIDQPYQSRLPEGMIRCYVVGDRVQGFGEQRINALFPAPVGRPQAEAPQPGPRLYFSPDRADVQRLKEMLDLAWIPEMCRILGMRPSDLPVLWDADFLLGAKDASGMDTYVLCEINVSSVYPFPPSALSPLVMEMQARIVR